MKFAIEHLRAQIEHQTYMAMKFEKAGNSLAQEECLQRVKEFKLLLEFANNYHPHVKEEAVV